MKPAPHRVVRSADSPLDGQIPVSSLGDLAQATLSSHATIVSTIMSSIFPQLQNGILDQLIGQQAILDDVQLLGFLQHLLGNQTGAFPIPKTMSPQQVAELIKVYICGRKITQL